jgi:hypothetical protein
MRWMTGLAALAVCLFLVSQGTGQEEKTKPDLIGKITDVKKAEEGKKGLGTVTVHTMKKGEPDGKDVTLRIGKKTEIMKGAGRKAPPEAATFDDVKSGEFALIWLAEGKADVAKKIVVFQPKKKAD